MSRSAPSLHVASNNNLIQLFLIALLVFTLGCRTDNSNQAFLPPDKKDISEIIEAVIGRDSLFNKKSIADSNIFPLSVDLRKIKVTVPDTTTEVQPPIDHSKVSIFDLFNSLVNHQRFFNRADSSYFLFQNSSIDSFVIDKTISNKITTTTFAEQQRKINSNQFVHYYDLTIPILSADNKKAYIELTRNCPFCGGATSFYLEKINSKWKVVGSQNLWIN